MQQPPELPGALQVEAWINKPCRSIDASVSYTTPFVSSALTHSSMICIMFINIIHIKWFRPYGPYKH